MSIFGRLPLLCILYKYGLAGRGLGVCLNLFLTKVPVSAMQFQTFVCVYVFLKNACLNLDAYPAADVLVRRVCLYPPIAPHS